MQKSVFFIFVQNDVYLARSISRLMEVENEHNRFKEKNIFKPQGPG
ncbi:MAG TPA: hypothetical protein PLJ84_05535 [Bacteroidales bacterium]|nr:hypothetical protein [Bacteroidales bacterium]